MNMGTRAANRLSPMMPWSLFPLVQFEVLPAMPPQCLSLRFPRVFYYFSLSVRDESDDVRMHYDAAVMMYWAHSVATALTMEIVNHRRVWTCSDECMIHVEVIETLETS